MADGGGDGLTWRNWMRLAVARSGSINSTIGAVSDNAQR